VAQAEPADAFGELTMLTAPEPIATQFGSDDHLRNVGDFIAANRSAATADGRSNVRERLAKHYSVSLRTADRWIARAKALGLVGDLRKSARTEGLRES
jgi:hypothetical protein